MSRESRSVRDYTIYAIIGTVVEESLLFAFLLWGLPYFGVTLSWWIIILIMGLSLGFSYFTYHMGRRALKKRITGGTESLVGSSGRVISPLNPSGYIRIRGETWKASADIPIEIDDEVTVTAAKGFTLTVKRTENSGQPEN